MKLLPKLLTITILWSSSIIANIELPPNFTSSFQQTITNPKGKIIRYSGKVYFSDQKLFKWIYTRPTQKEVCSNGTEILVIDHDLEQVSTYFIKKGLNISKILQKAKLYRKNIYVAKYDNKKYTIQLSNNMLHSIAYYDDLDNKVQIVFIDIKYANGSISSQTMKCIYPRKYDFIEG